MSGENAPGGQYHNEWANFSLATNIPRKVPMGENLKLAWSATGSASTQPLVITLSDDVQLELHWQEYRWVTELELLGQISVNGSPLLLTEKQVLQTGDDKRPFVIYERSDQKSICVTRLVAALHDPENAKMSMKQISQHLFHIQFKNGAFSVKFAVDVSAKSGVIYSSDSGKFPTQETNDHAVGLIDEPTADELIERAAQATDPSQMQKALTVNFTMKSDEGSPQHLQQTSDGVGWDASGRIPPFDASGKKRVDMKNAYIKAPFSVATPPSQMIAPNMTTAKESVKMGTRKAATAV
eukprot:TRINITY_DN63758_c0_g2_i1.p1 TRINITY_DN63758_c0_g2~~TRINITY_DN63758_c0_g2_i1.p1  ORF type:complete len:296 (+),score=31.87 TRINITY_DN63758_c0_g2_i1:44-931(+)